MGRECAQCYIYKSRKHFSANQLRKPEGISRCRDCVDGYVSYTCSICDRSFNTKNNLEMHLQTHRPRNISCPVCGETRFKSGANAVQHVESGYCTGCRGSAESAREQIYRFAQSKKGMRPFLTETPMLEYGDYEYDDDEYDEYGYDEVPDYPYQCGQCSIMFRNLSQLLQHQDNKHNNRRLLKY